MKWRTSIWFKDGASIHNIGKSIDDLRLGAPPNFILIPGHPTDKKVQWVSLDLIKRLEQEQVDEEPQV